MKQTKQALRSAKADVSLRLKAPFSSCRTRTTHLCAPFGWVGGKSKKA